jgi:hypothetical protein
MALDFSRFQPLTVMLPPQMRTQLQRLADQDMLTLSDVVRRACRREIEHHGGQLVLDDAPVAAAPSPTKPRRTKARR